MAAGVPRSDGQLNANTAFVVPRRPSPFLRLMRAIGSLWYAGVLLVLILVAMACATVYESAHGSAQALSVFYRSAWFAGLLSLLAVNVAAAMVVRFPFSKRQLGFVITHVSILVTLAGALVTARFGIDGQVGIAEGQTVDTLRLPIDTLTLGERLGDTRVSVSLDSRDFRKTHMVNRPNVPPLIHGDVQIEVARYLPDSEPQERIVNDNPMARYAIQVSLSESGTDSPQWVFAGKPQRIGTREILFHLISEPDHFAKLIEGKPAEESEESNGAVQITIEGRVFSYPMADCLANAVSVGDTAYTIRILKYYPHANVGSNGKLRNASNEPVNPAIEVELTGPEGKEIRLSFARFPDFGSMHGEKKMEKIKVVFVGPTEQAPGAPIEVLRGPDGTLVARFTEKRNRTLTRRLAVGTPVESPWPLQRFAVLDQFDHARVDKVVTPIELRKEGREPAVLVSITRGQDTKEMWLQKYQTHSLTVDGKPYELTYSDKLVPLGFEVTLDKFTIRHYPGGSMPRSFESDVTFHDATAGGSQSRLISMNHPADFGGLKFFQSSYRIDGRQRVSFLSVSRDPGMAIVFAGYVGIIGGMIIVLVTRATEHRRQQSATATIRADAEGHKDHRGNGSHKPSGSTRGAGTKRKSRLDTDRPAHVGNDRVT